jgi:hypothetical protein
VKQRFLLLKTACSVFCFFASYAVSAQSENSIFAPFVSHLQARSEGAVVTLTWSDSPSATGPVYIYRASQKFDEFINKEIPCAEVYYGRQTYTETVPSNGVFYYLVVAGDENKQKYEMVIPYHNMVEIRIDGAPHTAQASGFLSPDDSSGNFANVLSKRETANPSIIASGSEESQPFYGRTYIPPPSTTVMSAMPPVETRSSAVPKISSGANQQAAWQNANSSGALTGLTAIGEIGGIRITFSSGELQKKVVVYRNIAPIMRISDLLSSDVAHLPGAASPFVDKVTNDIPYYYAAVYDEDLRAGAAVISPPYNATLYPAVALKTSAAQSAPSAQPYISQLDRPRPENSSGKLSLEAEAALANKNFITPIPYQERSYSAPYQNDVPPSNYSSGVTGQRLYPPEITRPALEPHVFGQDLQSSAPGSDEYRLHLIVKGSFTWRNWGQAIAELFRFLVDSNDSQVKDRARFYLAQAYYFSASYNNALTEFLAIQSRFPNETSFWIQTTLSAISSQR